MTKLGMLALNGYGSRVIDILVGSICNIGAVNYTGTLDVKPKGSGSSVEWRVQYLADNQPNFIVKTIVATLLKTGLESLQKRFGAAKS